jgi:hypothetical protein
VADLLRAVAAPVGTGDQEGWAPPWRGLVAMMVEAATPDEAAFADRAWRDGLCGEDRRDADLPLNCPIYARHPRRAAVAVNMTPKLSDSSRGTFREARSSPDDNHARSRTLLVTV